MWDWGKGGKSPQELQFASRTLPKVRGNAPGSVRRSLGSRHGNETQALGSLFPLPLQLAKRRGGTGRRTVLQERGRCLLRGDPRRADPSTNSASSSSSCIYAFHFHALMRSSAVLLLPLGRQLDSELGSRRDSSNRRGQRDAFGSAGKGRAQHRPRSRCYTHHDSSQLCWELP